MFLTTIYNSRTIGLPDSISTSKKLIIPDQNQKWISKQYETSLGFDKQLAIGLVQLRDLDLEKRDPKTVAAIILGGGAGTRLFPLTKRRAKPAVSLSETSTIHQLPYFV